MDIRALLDDNTTAYDAFDVLGGYGFADAGKALKNLKLIADGVENPLLIGLLPGLLASCQYSADPDACLNSFERVSAACGSREGFLEVLSWEPDSVKVLAPVLASSKFLTAFITGDPEGMLGWLFSPGRLSRPKPREDMVRECLSACPPDTPPKEALAALRRFKYMELLRITVLDLLGREDISETTLELSNLADAALEAALGVASAELEKRFGRPQHVSPGGTLERCPFTVIAMGKLGGRELNYSSDIDVMFLYLTDQGETSGPAVVSNHQFFVKLGEMVSKLIADKTPDGFVFRVDTRLRPEGERGDLAQCLSGYEIYYESWGQTWERSALIKARPCAGDMGLGRGFLEMIKPFVFRKYLDFSAIGEIRDMKQRVEKAGETKGAGGIDFKLGPGGIREIEFFISSLQLLYGGREPGVREKNTLKALHRLALKGLISFGEQEDLTRAYEFLRRAEHRLQLVDERQTHSVSKDKAAARALALRMGYRDTASADAASLLMADYKGHAARVRKIYDGLFETPGGEAQVREEGLELLLARDLDETEAATILEKEGFTRPNIAFRNVLLLRDGSAGSALTPRSRQLFMKIMPRLLTGCAASPDPDMALHNLESFITSYGSRESMYALISDNPELGSLITRLFGSSEYFSRLLINHPEMSDILLVPGDEEMRKGKDGMLAELDASVGSVLSFAEKMERIRRFKHSEEVRIGIKDVFFNPGYKAISEDLTALAESVVETALRMSCDDLAARYGAPKGLAPGDGIAVIGMGKLGAGELGYGSDLDIIFVFEKAGSTTGANKIGSAEFFARLSERVIFALSSLTKDGFAFRVDTRLRPGGSKGVLALTLDALERYYEKDASVWELQALTRARPVAGDASLREGFGALRARVLTAPKDPDTLRAEVKKMRARMERELGGKKKKGVHHIKYGMGGIVDIEFIVQYLQLVHGAKHPELLEPETPAALDKLKELGLLTGEQGETLEGSYVFLRELESKLRITTSTAESVLPEDSEKLGVLAARMGYGQKGPEAGEALLADYRSHTEGVRGVFDELVA